MSELVQGKRYPRPCVRTIWNRMRKPAWIPVIGPVHDDIEIIGIRPKHWHVDFRFLPRNLRRPNDRAWGIHEVFQMPVSTVWPLADEGEEEQPVPVDGLPDPGIPVESYLRVMRRTFQEAYPGYPKRVSWMGRLEEAYRDSELLPGPVCPHRMAPLAGMEEDEDGCVTCPMHGLRWDLETGRLVPRGDGSR